MSKIKYIKARILTSLRKVQAQVGLQTAGLRSDFLYEFGIYKIVLWPCGLWPLEKDTIFNAIRYLLAASTQVRYHYYTLN